MSKDFTKADLKNIDFKATCKNNCDFLQIYDPIGRFKVVLKDGRKFYCSQDLSHVFIIRSKYGNMKGDLFVKIASDLMADNDKFVVMTQGIKLFIYRNVWDNFGHYSDLRFDEASQDLNMAIIEDCGLNIEDLIVKLLKMGLRKNNKFVTIKPISKK